MSFRPALLVLLLGAAVHLADFAPAPVSADTGSAAPHVWWEGEDFEETNLAEPVRMDLPGHRTPEQRRKLSGGRWLTPHGARGEGPFWIEYTVEVPEAGTYDFYVRKFWKHGPFRWRFGKQPWRTLGRDVALLDETYLQKHWGANWVSMGELTLEAGRHPFRVEMLEPKGAIDSFLLIQGPFLPRGKLKPGERSGKAEPGYFAWEPPPDPLTGEAPIDLRRLNETLAGADGFVRRRGEDFVLASGRPVRFWMVQADLLAMEPETVERWARRLAKYGVNLVRMQLGAFFQDRMAGRDDAFRRRLDRLHHVVAALKREGIYSYFGHLYWHTSGSSRIPEAIHPGFGDGKNAIALLFFSPRFQAWYQDYVRAIMMPENPYTGRPLAEEPAVAFLEIQNESGLLFWTFKPGKFPEPERALVERDFGDWLQRRYGSLEKARAAWGPDSGKHTPDRFDEGRAGLYDAGFLTGADWAVRQRNPRRAGDQLAWMVESARRFYTRMKRQLGAELGQLITGSNWHTADERVLGALERYTYTATDAVLRNSYFSTEYPDKEARQRFYAVEEGDTYRSRSALKPPAAPGPLATPQPAGHPFMVTENNWTRPNRYRAEWPFLVAAYGSLAGIDGWNFFALGAAEWQVPMDVWDLNNPTVLGQFPGAALVYRRGDVTEPDEPAVLETISLKEAYALQGTRLRALPGRDALWAGRRPKEAGEAGGEAGGGAGGGTGGGAGVDPRAFFVGPMRQRFRRGPAELESIDLTEFIDPEARTRRAMTGQLAWNYDQGVVTLDTPRAQGATGFLAAAGPIELSDLTLRSENTYGSILVVSLDDRPLARSRRVLIQAATHDKPYGFRTRPAGRYRRIVDLGGHPLNVRRIRARLTLRTAGREAIVLDGNGYLTERRAPSEAAEGRLTLELPENAIYTLIR